MSATNTAPPIPDPAQAPAVHPVVRSVGYFTALVVGAAYGPVVGVAVVFGWDPLTAAAVVGALGSFVATVAGGLGVAYRPRSA